MIKSLKYFSLLIAISYSALTAAKAEVSANIILDACLSSEEAAILGCHSYITGSIEGMGWGAGLAAFQSESTDAEAMRDLANSFLGVCKPDATTGNQLYEIVLKFMRNHPEKWHEPAVNLILLALRDAFPCE